MEMKNIFGSVLRHAIGAAGAILAYLATVDMQSLADISTDVQAIIGATMTIGAAVGGIMAKVKSKRVLVASVEASAQKGYAVTTDPNTGASKVLRK